MELKDEWFRPAAYYLIKAKRMKQKDVAELFGMTGRFSKMERRRTQAQTRIRTNSKFRRRGG